MEKLIRKNKYFVHKRRSDKNILTLLLLLYYNYDKNIYGTKGGREYMFNDLRDALRKIEELEKENAELKAEIQEYQAKKIWRKKKT